MQFINICIFPYNCLYYFNCIAQDILIYAEKEALRLEYFNIEKLADILTKVTWKIKSLLR